MRAARLEVLGGTGTVYRKGGLVAWLGSGFPPEAAAEILESARAAIPGGKAVDLAAAMAALVAIADSFCVAIESDDTLSIILRGHVVVSEDGVERLRGQDTQQLVFADLRFGATVTVRGANDPDLLDRPGALPFDLREGVVPGGGFTFWDLDRRGTAASVGAGEAERASVEADGQVNAEVRAEPEGPFPTEEPAPPEEEAGGERPVSLGLPSLEPSVVLFDLSAPGPVREPLPLASSPAVSEREAAGEDVLETEGSRPAGSDAAAAGAPGGVAEALSPGPLQPQSADVVSVVSDHRQLVMGVNCARGHFNNPHALYCGICGLAMVQNSVIVVEGPRPPLGVLLADDGTAYSLESDYILGRQPELAEDVVAGHARPLKVDDGTGKISRVHAKVALRDWDVVVSDLRSHNGTRLFNPGETTWLTLIPDEPVVLRPGGRLVVGQCTFEFQSIQRQ